MQARSTHPHTHIPTFILTLAPTPEVLHPKERGDSDNWISDAAEMLTYTQRARINTIAGRLNRRYC